MSPHAPLKLRLREPKLRPLHPRCGSGATTHIVKLLQVDTITDNQNNEVPQLLRLDKRVRRLFLRQQVDLCLRNALAFLVRPLLQETKEDFKLNDEREPSHPPDDRQENSYASVGS